MLSRDLEGHLVDRVAMDRLVQDRIADEVLLAAIGDLVNVHAFVGFDLYPRVPCGPLRSNQPFHLVEVLSGDLFSEDPLAFEESLASRVHPVDVQAFVRCHSGFHRPYMPRQRYKTSDQIMPFKTVRWKSSSFYRYATP